MSYLGGDDGGSGGGGGGHDGGGGGGGGGGGNDNVNYNNARKQRRPLTTSSRRCRGRHPQPAAVPRDAATGWEGTARRLNAPQPAVGVATRAGTEETAWWET
jgi:hypothetical protein